MPAVLLPLRLPAVETSVLKQLGLTHDYPVLQAVQVAKTFVNQAIQKGFFVNPYVGHVWHGAYFQAEKRLEESK